MSLKFHRWESLWLAGLLCRVIEEGSPAGQAGVFLLTFSGLLCSRLSCLRWIREIVPQGTWKGNYWHKNTISCSFSGVCLLCALWQGTGAGGKVQRTADRIKFWYWEFCQSEANLRVCNVSGEQCNVEKVKMESPGWRTEGRIFKKYLYSLIMAALSLIVNR